MDKFVSADEFRAAARQGSALSPVLRLATGTAAEVENEVRTLRFCFSDGSIDRAGDMIEPKGWELESFLKNPIALWAHSSYEPPIGRAKNVAVTGGRLMGDIEFADAETYGFADTVYRLAKGGYINAVSVGFNPLEWTFVNDKDRPYGIDFKRQELLEISACPVPCNANALIEARAKGIDTAPLREWAERVLDGEGGEVRLSRVTLEEIFKATNTPHSVRARYKALLEKPAAASGGLPVEVAAGGSAGAAEAAKAGGSCGREKDEECGMIDPAECMIHAPENKSASVELSEEVKAMLAKAGRRISAKNKAMLEQAIGHHESATKCIKDVLDDPGEGDDAGGDPESPEAQDITEDLNPTQRRLKEVRSIRETLAA